VNRDRNVILTGVIVSVIFVAVGTLWLCHSEETLDRVAGRLGIGELPVWNPPIPDYEIPGYEGNILINLVLGVGFTLFVLGVTLIVGEGLRTRKRLGVQDRSLLGDFLKTFEDIMYFERFTGTKGILQEINPSVKLLSLVALILSAIAAKTIYPLLILFVVVIILCIFSKIPLGYFLKRATLFIPVFAALIASPLLFMTPGTVLAQIMIGPVLIQPTIEGFLKATVFTFRIWICVATLNLLVLTTRFSQIIHSMDRLRFPKLFVTMIAITYRFIFLFIDEAYRMILAKESRTAARESRIRNLRSLANMFATLFVRAYEKGERVYLAMLARGFTPETRMRNELKIKTGDWLFLTASFSICVVISSIELLRLVG